MFSLVRFNQNLWWASSRWVIDLRNRKNMRHFKNSRNKIIHQVISFLTSTTKHVIPTTPVMWLVTHSQGSTLDLILRRSKLHTKTRPSPNGEKRNSDEKRTWVPANGIQPFLRNVGKFPRPHVVTVWSHYRKSSTVNQYANPWLKWVEWNQSAGSQPIPVNPFLFATWLTTTSFSDTTKDGAQVSLSLVKRISQHHQHHIKLLEWHGSLLWEN